MDGDQLADAAGCCGAGIGRRFHGTDVTAREDRHIPSADVLFADQDDVGGLDHGIGGLNGADEATRFNHAEGVCAHEDSTG